MDETVDSSSVTKKLEEELSKRDALIQVHYNLVIMLYLFHEARPRLNLWQLLASHDSFEKN